MEHAPPLSTSSSRSSSTLSTAPSGATSPRLSRLNSSSGSLSQKALQGFRTVSLPGLFPGTHLGILASGLLDKRRDGAVRGGWARRLFILSTRSLHYYRKTEDAELFGRERGQTLLADIGFAKVVPAEDAPYGAVEPGAPAFFLAVLSKRKTLLLFLRADSADYAAGWVNIINNAVHQAKGLNFAPRWPADMMQNFITAAAGNFEVPVSEPSPTEESPETQSTQASPPRVLVISVASNPGTANAAERLVRRNVLLDKEVEIGVLGKKDVCVLVLSDGEEVVVGRHLLGDNPAALLATSKQISVSTPPRSQVLHPNVVIASKITMSFRCSRAPPAPMARQESGTQPTSAASPSAFQVAFPGTLGGLFLLSCVVSFYCSSPFEGLMKITIVLGVLLSISQIVQFAVCAYDAQNATQAAKKSPASTVQSAVGSSGTDSAFIFHLRVDSIEVVEMDQDTAPPLAPTMSPMSEMSVVDSPDSGMSADNQDESDERQTLSAGPIAFSPRFIAAEKGDEVKGRQRYQNTLEWRKENGIDTILVEPHPTFDTIKKYYPQYFHGRSREGQPVYYERPGKIDLPALKREGLSLDDLLRHYMYITEYQWRVLEPNDSGRSITVLDVTGIGMYDLGGEVLDFIKRASAFTGAHYPERSAHIFIINIPGWFNMIWRMIKPLIDPVTREKVHMLKGSAILRELETLIDLDNIPSDLGGNGPKLGESSEEIALAEHVQKYLN